LEGWRDAARGDAKAMLSAVRIAHSADDSLRAEDRFINLKVRRARERHICLAKTPSCSSHGIQFAEHDLFCLVLTAEPEASSLLAQHNKSEPDYCMRKGDFIVEVNGIRGSPEELEVALLAGDSWKIGFRRNTRPPSSGAATDSSPTTNLSSERTPSTGSMLSGRSSKAGLQIRFTVDGAEDTDASPQAHVEEEFKRVLDLIKTFKFVKPVPLDRRLILYALYKQATEGDIGSEKPGLLEGFWGSEKSGMLGGLFGSEKPEGDIESEKPGLLGFEARGKWDAWNSCKGKSKAQSQQEYIHEFEKQKCDFM